MAVSVDEPKKVIATSSRCAACGQEFPCCAAAGCESESTCWCFGVEVAEAARSELSRRYETCLCKQCLTKWSDFNGKICP